MLAKIIANFPYIAVVLIAVVGIAMMLFKRNLIKVLMGLSLVESAVNLFLVATGYRQGGVAPIFTNAPGTHMVMPTVQALTLTSIVIGVATSAMMLSFVMIIFRNYGTVNAEKIRKLKG